MSVNAEPPGEGAASPAEADGARASAAVLGEDPVQPVTAIASAQPAAARRSAAPLAGRAARMWILAVTMLRRVLPRSRPKSLARARRREEASTPPGGRST